MSKGKPNGAEPAMMGFALAKPGDNYRFLRIVVSAE
jgi:hypothetical protein